MTEIHQHSPFDVVNFWIPMRTRELLSLRKPLVDEVCLLLEKSLHSVPLGRRGRSIKHQAESFFHLSFSFRPRPLKNTTRQTFCPIQGRLTIEQCQGLNRGCSGGSPCTGFVCVGHVK